MKRDIKAPSVGESITEVRIGRWAKQSGQAVRSGEVLLEIESDKATVEVVAETSGVLTIARQTGDTVRIGEVLGSIVERQGAVQERSSLNATDSAPVDRSFIEESQIAATGAKIEQRREQELDAEQQESDSTQEL